MAKYKLRIFTKTQSTGTTAQGTPVYKFTESPTTKEWDSVVSFDATGHFVCEEKFTRKLYLDRASVGLAETKSMIVLGEDSDGNIAPLSELSSYAQTIADGWKLFFYIDTTEQENLRFFTVDEGSDTVKWTDRILLDPSNANDFVLNLGFIGDKEGQYEDNIYVCEINTRETDVEKLTGIEDIEHTGTMTVYSMAVGEDERYRNLFENFGLPDPITYMDVFMDTEDHTNIPNYQKYDDKIDYQKLNEKSKQLFLSYHEIFPFVGTYKALINAVDFLGYDDVYFKEWFRELTDDSTEVRYTTYDVAYKSSSNNTVIAKLPIERRVLLKKLNWLTMVYRISEELLDAEGVQMFDELPDNVRIPRIKQNYTNYQAQEILVKLIALKKWLEKYIIGLNCRIIDINGEGLVVERYKHKIYGKTEVGLDYYEEHSLTPIVVDKKSDLLIKDSSANIAVRLKEQGYKDSSMLDDFNNFYVKAIVSTKNSALSKASSIATQSGESQSATFGITDKTVLVQDGEIFFDPKDVYNGEGGLCANFVNLPTICIEKARLRNPNKPWSKSIEYIITNEDAEIEGKYVIREITTGKVFSKSDTVSLKPLYGESEGSLKYTANNKLGVPLFIMQNFEDQAIPNAIRKDEDFILEILDGKFIFNEYINGVYRTTYLNIHFDSDANEQDVEMNYVYTKSVDMSQSLYDTDTTEKLLTSISVNNIGDYRLYVYGIDQYGNIHCAQTDNTIRVIAETPSIEVYTATQNSNNTSDFFGYNEDGAATRYDSVSNSIPSSGTPLKTSYASNKSCLMTEQYLLNDIKVNKKDNGGVTIKYVTYPTISYAIDTPKEGDIAHFMNLTDNFECVKIEKITAESVIQPSEKNTYDYVSAKNYTIIWLKRNKLFEATTLNDGINIDSSDLVSSFDPCKLTNIVIYDNIHAEAFYQELCYLNYDINAEFGEKLNYIIISTDTLSDIYLYYNEKTGTSTGLQKVNYETPIPIDHHKYIMITPDAESDGGSMPIEDMFTDNKLFKIFCQPAYEIPVAEISQDQDDEKNNRTKIVFKSGYYTNFEKMFHVDQHVKLSYEISIDDKNTVTSQNLFTVVEVGLDYIKIDGTFKYDFDSSKNIMLFDPDDIVTTSSPIKANWEKYTQAYVVNGKKYYQAQYYDYNCDEPSKSKTPKMYYYSSTDNNIPKDEEIPQVKTEIENTSITITETGLSTPRLYISQAHNAFTDYEMDVDHAKELKSGYTELFVKDDTLMDYVDNTFAVSSKPYDLHNAFDMWMDGEGDTAEIENELVKYPKRNIQITNNPQLFNCTSELVSSDNYAVIKHPELGVSQSLTYNIYKKDDSGSWVSIKNITSYRNRRIYIPYANGEYKISATVTTVIERRRVSVTHTILFNLYETTVIYKHNIPITLTEDNSHIILAPDVNGSMSYDQNDTHCHWNIYKFDRLLNKNVLLFESWNNVLFLTPEEKGIYTIELNIYDEYGNMSTYVSEGLFKIKEKAEE